MIIRLLLGAIEEAKTKETGKGNIVVYLKILILKFPNFHITYKERKILIFIYIFI